MKITYCVINVYGSFDAIVLVASVYVKTGTIGIEPAQLDFGALAYDEFDEATN